MWQRTLGIVGAWGALACATASPAAKPAAVVAAPAPPLAVAPAMPRVASAAAARHWVFDDKAQFALYAGLGSLMHTELFAGLVPGVLAESEELLKAPERDCLLALATQARDLLLGADERGGLLILELGVEGVKATRSACVGSLFSAERVTVAGADEAYGAGGNDVVAVQSGVALFGSKSLVEAALRAVQEPKPLGPSLALKADQQLVFRLNLAKEALSGVGALSVSPERFRLEVDVELPNEAVADMVEQKVQEGREQAKLLGQNRPEVPLARLVGALDVQRRGKHFTSAFELREPVADQARDLGTLIGLSVYGVRRYMKNAKSAEARSTIAQIARAYGASLQLPAAGGKPALKRLKSLPAVPAAVPRGVKYQSSPEDWKAWAAIHFALGEPQYHQYEVVAAKDGKTAEILARGDLNGDGKTSLFRVKVELDPKTGQLTAVDHTEQDPLE